MLDKHDLEQIGELVDRILEKRFEQDLFPLLNESFSAAQNATNERFDAQDKKFGILIEKVVDHDERLERIESTMMTKAEYRHLLGTVEDIATDVKKIKDDRLERHERDILAIKLKLQMA